ncbi:MAG TPA: DoxX family protein [Gemmatimonadales bacterium]|nr:DoxX family protein [Gemmatimonadales bacterium]
MGSTAATSAGVEGGGPFHWLLRTTDDTSLTVLRLALGIVMLPHGAQKALGWFGGPGLSGFVEFTGTQYGIPAWLAAFAVAAECLGSLGLLLGLFGRIAAFGISCNMVVAIALIHRHNGFFMNWTGKQAGEGFEFHLLVIGIAIVIMLRGSGAASIDRALSRS